MSNNKTFVLQHEPLRVPVKWDGDARAFVIQMERILNDAYWRIGDLTQRVKALEAAVQEEED